MIAFWESDDDDDDDLDVDVDVDVDLDDGKSVHRIAAARVEKSLTSATCSSTACSICA